MTRRILKIDLKSLNQENALFSHDFPKEHVNLHVPKGFFRVFMYIKLSYISDML